MTPETEPPDTLSVPSYAEKCPRCGNTHLGLMLTLHLEFCPVCDTWIRFDNFASGN
jgi:hypothetical protein